MRVLSPAIALCFLALPLLGCAEEGPNDELEIEQTAAVDTTASPLASFAGNWEAEAIMESGDTVQYTLVATDDTEGWMVTLPGREPMELRVISAEGDSVMTEMGPYESLLREGVEVTVRQVTRIQDGRMIGRMEAHYAGGEGSTMVGGDIEGRRTN